MNDALEPRFDVEVALDLDGPDGNVFVVIGAVKSAIRRSGGTEDDVRDYRAAVMAGDYENALKVTRETVRLVDLGGAR
jgi:hypothetical protein